jgi:hypothetical protein
MIGDVVQDLQIQIYREVSMPNGDRIVQAEPILDHWASMDLANHNIFCLDAHNAVVWRVRRVEDQYVNWEVRHQHARDKDPGCEGYFDPFYNMSSRFFERLLLPDKGPFHPTEQLVWFDDYAPGRLLSIITHWWAYDLDPVTGVAVCTGEQVK